MKKVYVLFASEGKGEPKPHNCEFNYQVIDTYLPIWYTLKLATQRSYKKGILFSHLIIIILFSTHSLKKAFQKML